MKVRGDPPTLGLLRRHRRSDQPLALVVVGVDRVEQVARLEPDAQQVGVRLEGDEVGLVVGPFDVAVQRHHAEDVAVDPPRRQAQSRDPASVLDAEQLAVRRRPRPVVADQHRRPVARHLAAHSLTECDVDLALDVRGQGGTQRRRAAPCRPR